MTEPFKITEVIQCGKTSEFQFKGLKELTPELLGLVTEYRIYKIDEIAYNEIKTIIVDNSGSFQDKNFNLDTLTRLIADWLISMGILPDIGYGEFGWYCKIAFVTDEFNGVGRTFIGLDEEQPRLYTMLEAIVKAMHWVAKEKGLI